MNRLFLIFTALIVVLAFSGCGWLFGPSDGGITPEEETSAAIAEVESNRAALEAANAALSPAGVEYNGFSAAFMRTFTVEHKSGLTAQTLSIPMPPIEERLTAKGLRQNKCIKSLCSSWPNCVVPVAMEIVAMQVDLCPLFVRDFTPRWIPTAI